MYSLFRSPRLVTDDHDQRCPEYQWPTAPSISSVASWTFAGYGANIARPFDPPRNGGTGTVGRSMLSEFVRFSELNPSLFDGLTQRLWSYDHMALYKCVYYYYYYYISQVNNLLSKFRPWSEWIWRGSPNLGKHPSYMARMQVEASASGRAKAHAHLVK